MPVTPALGIYDAYLSVFEDIFTPIGKLRRQRKADCKPKKPKPVTDEQLLAIVEELEAKIKKLETGLDNETTFRKAEDAAAGRFVARNFRLKWFALVKHSVVGLERYTAEREAE